MLPVLLALVILLLTVHGFGVLPRFGRGTDVVGKLRTSAAPQQRSVSFLASSHRVHRPQIPSWDGALWATSQKDGDEADNSKIGFFDSVKYFFSVAKVSEITGQYTEQIVADVLQEAGFKPYPIAYEYSPRLEFKLRNDSKLGEIDALVQGTLADIHRLVAACPVHFISDDLLLFSAEPKILAIEVKATAVTLLGDLKDAKKKKGGKYWLFENRDHGPYKAIFINGGQHSKNFILHGGNSAIKEEQELWHDLRAANVSLFYKESFTLEWVSEFSLMVDKQAGEIEKHAGEISLLNLMVDKHAGEIEKLAGEIEKQTGEISQLNLIVDKHAGEISLLKDQVGQLLAELPPLSPQA